MSTEPSAPVLIYSHTTERRLWWNLNGERLFVLAHVTESVDLTTGDHVESVTVDELIRQFDGQSIIPAVLSFDDMRALSQEIKRTTPVMKDY